jgi:hypothetical protein
MFLMLIKDWCTLRAADDGIAAGEPTECFNPVAAVMRAEALAQGRPHRRRRIGARVILPIGDLGRRHGDQ